MAWTTPASSWDGARGYSSLGKSPSLVIESLGQTPQASTFTRTEPAGGSEISRSTISNGAFGRGTTAMRIVDMEASPDVKFEQCLTETIALGLSVERRLRFY